MSKEYWGFENEDGSTAFLAGVVDVLSDNLSLTCDYAVTLDADIFYVKDNDVSLLNDAVKKRLHYYNKRYGLKISEKKIDTIDFKLEKENCKVNDYFKKVMSHNSSNSQMSEKVDEFLQDLEWYLQKPLTIYSPMRNDKNIDVLGHIYLYMAWSYFFIEYDDYMVLVIFGTVE